MNCMRAVDIIRKKRDRHVLDPAEIGAFVAGATSGSWPDYQVSALLMAIWLRGMNAEETLALTREMTRSGQVLDLGEIPGPKADKHSTGGVGDSTSLVLVPLAVACGVVVPMMSGRGLGHTGGTLDKLESIPGFRTGLSIDEMKSCLRDVGAVMIGQTADVAPADRKLYALRDVTGTVESIPLIAASIMSKKLAEGIGSLVLDVKFGDGAFIKDIHESRKLARTMVDIGRAQGVRTQALLTSMNNPLGFGVGNSLEVIECHETLKSRGPDDITELSVELAARLVHLAGVAPNLEDARERVTKALKSGEALERWRRIVERQGGDPRCVDDCRLLPLAPKHLAVKAERGGYVASIAAEAIGLAAMRLGAGRSRAEDAVDHGVGILLRVVVGERVKDGDTIAEVYGRDDAKIHDAAATVRAACYIGDDAPAPQKLIRETID
jgi:pyrimidine-nucleoside phosphorylase